MVEPKDRMAQGDPEWLVLLPGRGAIVGLYIKGLPDAQILGIREDADGQIVSCAVMTELNIDTARPFHSTPHRRFDPPSASTHKD